MPRDTVGRTFAVAATLCIVCSVVVSTAAVALRDRQEENKQLDRNRNILIAAGVIPESPRPPREEILRLYEEKVRPDFVDLATGETVEPTEVGINPANWDPRGAARDPKYGMPVDPPDALFGVNSRAKYAFVYKVMDGERVDSYVLPIYGNGLWSTLYGFLALRADAREVKGITFYEHGETPGLGGEVENAVWKASWTGKLAFDDQGDVIIEVIKGQVTPGSPGASHQIDGLSGATITTRGVSSLVQYWLGPEGFGKYLERVRSDGMNGPAGEADRGKP